MTEIPEEFKRFSRCFFNGSLESAPSEHEWIERALRLNSPKQLAVVKRFLDEVLRDSNGPELQRIWHSGEPVYALADAEELRMFLSLVRDLIK